MTGPLVKAVLKPVNPDRDPIPCLFNPREYTLQRTNTWRSGENATHDVGDLSFGGGGGAKLSLPLFFDTTLYGAGGPGGRDVRAHTDRLWTLMLIDGRTRHEKTGRGTPPEVIFQWGTTWYFRAVITGMQQQFSLFLADGTPVRATVTLELQQTEDRPLDPAHASRRQSEALRARPDPGNRDLRRDFGGADPARRRV